MKKNWKIFLGLFSLVFYACSDDSSHSQASSQTIKVFNASNQPIPGVVVQAQVVDDLGVTLDVLETQITDSEGSGSFSSQWNSGSTIVFKALIPSGALRAFPCPTEDVIIIDSISEALVSAVLKVTESEGERSLTDFSMEELQNLNQLTRAAFSSASLEFNDVTEVENFLLESVGRKIADASGGTISSEPIDGLVEPDVETIPSPTETSINCPREHWLLTSDYFRFDINQDGAICNGEAVSGPISDAFDVAFQLHLEGETFEGQSIFPGDSSLSPSPIPDVTLEDGYELRLGPLTTDSGNLEVTRKVAVLEDGDVVRYLEIFKNLGSEAIEIGIRVEGDLGLTHPIRVLFAQNSSFVLDEASQYGALITYMPNETKPAVGFLMDGNGGGDQADQVVFPPQETDYFVYAWNQVRIPVGETKVYAHYVYVNASQLQSDIQLGLENLYQNPPMQGLSADELNHLSNFKPSIGNVVGEAGSVASYASLTLTQSNYSVEVNANSDGSFKAAIFAQSGDQIHVVGTDGTDQTLLVP